MKSKHEGVKKGISGTNATWYNFTNELRKELFVITERLLIKSRAIWYNPTNVKKKKGGDDDDGLKTDKNNSVFINVKTATRRSLEILMVKHRVTSHEPQPPTF